MSYQERSSGVRELIREAAGNGIKLWVDGSRLSFSTSGESIPIALSERLRSRAADLVGALSRPVFAKRTRPPEAIPYPALWLDFWLESEASIAMANRTHAVLKLEGRLTTERLTAAFAALDARHGLLLARMELRDGVPCLLFGAARSELLRVVDVSNEPPASRVRLAEGVIEQAVWSRLEEGSVFRACAVKSGPREYFVALVLHHFIGDFFSCDILVRDLIAELKGDVERRGVPAGRPVQYSDYLLGLFEWLSGPGPEYRLAYWRSHMAGAPATYLPRVCSENAGSRELGALSFAIEAALRAELARTAASLKVTIAELILAANLAALAEITQSDDVVTIAIHAGRDDPALAGMVGNTVDCLPLRARISEAMTMAELAGQVHANYAAAQEFRVPWSLLMRTLRQDGVSCIAPLFNFITGKYGVQRAPTSFLYAAVEEIQGLRIKRPPETGNVDWKSHQLDVFDSGISMAGTVKYDPSSCSDDTIAAFRDALVRLLQTVAREPNAAIRP